MSSSGISGSAFVGEDLVRQPILHPPADEPDRHWKTEGYKTFNEIVDRRRRASEPFPTEKASRSIQQEIDFGGGDDVQTQGLGLLDSFRAELRDWRGAGYSRATRATRTFLEHLASGKERERSHNLFFAQREAVETVVYLTEACGSNHKMILHLKTVADDYNEGLTRLALRMATGTGKTAVMACLIAWYAINRKTLRNTDRGLSRNVDRIIVVCPGRTVRSRLAVLNPRAPANIFDEWQLLPDTLRPRLNGIKVNIINFEQLQPRTGISRTGLDVGKNGLSVTKINSVLGVDKSADRETHNEMWSRVLGLDARQAGERAVVLNDEGHHCWNRSEGEKPGVWMEALQALRHHPRVKFSQAIDLTATPIFINPGKSEGYDKSHDNLFPWIVSEFALAESMESGLVKIPRLPAVNVGSRSSKLRNLYKTNGGKPLKNETTLKPVREAAELLYEDYRQTFDSWKRQDDPRLGEPVLIAVVNTKANAEMLFRTLGGYRDDGGQLHAPDGFELFANVPRHGCSDDECEMRSILVVSKSGKPETVEGGFALSSKHSQLGIRSEGEPVPADEEVQRVLQTVGQPGQAGESVRCVVSVGMLTEGWDCQRVTHILGYRKFGSQLLCEQVLGRALRRQDYENRINVRRKDSCEENERYPAEYAVVIGVPFQNWLPGSEDSSTESEKSEEGWPSPPPRPAVDVYPVEARLPQFEIWVPAIKDYCLVVPPGRLELDIDKVNNCISTLGQPSDFMESFDTAEVEGPFGQAEMLQRPTTNKPGYGAWLLAVELTRSLQEGDADFGHRASLLFSDCLTLVREWLTQASGSGWTDKIICENEGARKSAADALLPAIKSGSKGEPIKIGIPIDRRNPLRSASRWRRFSTRLKDVAELQHSELNVAACHSRLERDFALELDASKLVAAVTRNHGPQRFEIPYRNQGAVARYVPDFFIRLHNHAQGPTVHVILEVKGIADQLSERKEIWTKEWWIPAANEVGRNCNQRWIYVKVGPGSNIDDAIASELKLMDQV